MDTVCQTSITPELYARLKDCEAAAVRKYDLEDGSAFAKIIGAGTQAEMDELCSGVGLVFIIPPIKEITQYVVPVSELLLPEDGE